MSTDEKLAAILAAIQTDPGKRGLEELFTACPNDFAAACRSIAEHPQTPALGIVTGFYIPSATPPAFETDGPLGAIFLARAMNACGIKCSLVIDPWCMPAIVAGLNSRRLGSSVPIHAIGDEIGVFTHLIAIERVGPNRDERFLNMRGQDITDYTNPVHEMFVRDSHPPTIGIGDGGNEIGMGRIRHDIIGRNIVNGDRIHCRVSTDLLIVAGVSNWGAYALAAGIHLLRGVAPAPDLFDPDHEREILEIMVKEGPLVDGVTGKQTATVDGLTWEAYVKPLVHIREIMRA
ncbi:MAG TPA: DUF4392 domain-containing protein [Urbifossiella sp.]